MRLDDSRPFRERDFAVRRGASSRARRRVGALGHLWTRLVHVLAIGVLALGLLQGGTRYFFCPFMNVTSSHPCCGEAAGAEPSTDARDVPSARTPDCCRGKRLGVVPAATPSPPQLGGGPLVMAAIEPGFGQSNLAWTPLAPVRSLRPPARAGPPPANRRRAALMTWTC